MNFRIRFAILTGLALAAAGGGGTGIALAEEPVLRKIAFGSCAHQSKEQPIWREVLAHEPDLFVMLGDNIYGDTTDMAVLQAKYGQLAAQPGFKKLRETCPILAVWDDHDFGENDAGAEYPRKFESEQIFLDFFEVPQDSPRREHMGIYDRVTFGPEGKRVQFILLDTRFFRSPLIKRPKEEWPSKGRYAPVERETATMLGQAQWAWLEETLREPADLRILASSIQIVPVEQGWEKWGNFPLERKRLMALLKETDARRTVIISGDRHIGEISHLPARDKAGPGFDLWEITSSGLTESWGDKAEEEPNRFRTSPDNYKWPNFGVIGLDWGKDGGIAVTLQVRKEDGTAAFSEKVIFK